MLRNHADKGRAFWRLWLAYIPLSVISMSILMGAAASAMAAEQVALITEVTGKITPALEAFTEVEAGSSIDLGTDGRLEFLHYPTCQKVVAEGGKLTLSSENFRVNKGKIIDLTKAECPQRVQLASNEAGAGIAGVVLRGAGDGTLKVSQRPRFLLLGAAVGQFKSLEITEGGKSLLVMPLGNAPLIWPESNAPLQPAGDYTAVLTGADAKIRRLPLQVTNQKMQHMPAIIHID